MNVGEALNKFPRNFGEGPFIQIHDKSTIYQGTTSYFIFNGAYSYLREKEIECYSLEDKYIIVK